MIFMFPALRNDHILFNTGISSTLSSSRQIHRIAIVGLSCKTSLSDSSRSAVSLEVTADALGAAALGTALGTAALGTALGIAALELLWALLFWELL